MAQVGYNSVPSILPNEQQPNDYIHVQTNPGQFGGEIAQGLEGFGKGAMAAADKWGNVQTSDMSNQFQTEANNLAENYVTKQGRDALDAHENSIKAAQDLYDKKRNELSTPDQFARFDAENRPFLQRNIVGRMNTHANEQGLKFADNTAKDGIKIAYNMAATAGSTGNEAQGVVWAQKAADRAMDVLRNIGQDRDPDAVKAARTTAIAGAYKTYSEALAAAGRPSDAYDFAKKHLDDLGSEGPQLLDSLNQKAKTQQGQQGADRLITQVASDLRSGATAAGGPGYSYSAAVSKHESGGNAGVVNSIGAGGLYQFTPATWNGLAAKHPELGLQPGGNHDASPEGVAKQNAAFAAFTNDNRSVLKSAGVEPNDKNTFMAHFLGSGGAVKFFHAAQQNPNATFADVFPKEAAANPTIAWSGRAGRQGAPRTLAEVYSLMTRNFSGAQTVVGSSNPTLGGAAPATPSPDAGYQPPSPAAPGATSDLPVQNASATDQTPATPEPPKPPTPEDIRAESYKRIMSDPAYDDPIVRAAAERRVEETYTKSAIAAEQDRKSKEANKERALNDVNQLVNKGDHEGAYAALRKHLENKEIDDTEYARASGAILKSLGEEDPMTYGRNYLNVRHRALADASDPNKIYSNSQLYDEYEKGNINWKGVTRISEMLIGKRRDQLDFIGKEHSITAAYDQIGQGLTYANDAYGLKDPAGRAYKDKAIIDFDAKLNDWIKKGGDLDKFPLFDPKHLDDFIGLYRDKKKMAADQMREMQQRMNGTFVPPAPEGVPNSKGWDTVIANPPWLATGKRGSAQDWAKLVELLAKDPSLEAVNEWDDYLKKTDLTAGYILQSLGIPLPAGYTPKKKKLYGDEYDPNFLPPG